MANLPAMADGAGWDAHLLDSTVVRAHAQAAGARRTAGGQALGRSRGGFSTEPHLRCDGRGRPVAFHATGGERHDLLGVGPLFERGALRTGKRGRPRWKPGAMIADGAYSAAWLLDALRRKRICRSSRAAPTSPRTPTSTGRSTGGATWSSGSWASSSGSGAWRPATGSSPPTTSPSSSSPRP